MWNLIAIPFILLVFLIPTEHTYAKDDKEIQKQRREAQKERQTIKNET